MNLKAISGRVGKVETVLYGELARAVPCAFHALSDITPTPPNAKTWEGGCVECGGPLTWHSTDAPARVREAYQELYPVGYSPEKETIDLRRLALLAWTIRQPPSKEPPPSGAYARALMAEHSRRMAPKWAAQWERASDDILKAADEMLRGRTPTAELEAIIWPQAVGS